MNSNKNFLLIKNQRIIVDLVQIVNIIKGAMINQGDMVIVTKGMVDKDNQEIIIEVMVFLIIKIVIIKDKV